MNNNSPFQDALRAFTPPYNFHIPLSGEPYPVPIKSWDIVNPKIWIEEKPMQEKNEVRVKVPAGTRFTEIVIEFEGSDKEHAIVDASLAYRWNNLSLTNEPVRTLKVVERENETLRLERALSEATKKAVEVREKYNDYRREVEKAAAERNRARSALENHRRKVSDAPVNPFA